jgi:signal transduction histidine kinase
MTTFDRPENGFHSSHRRNGAVLLKPFFREYYQTECVGPESRTEISMRADLAAGLHRVRADRVQLQQVLMNLMLNAIEAMKDSSGELTIKSEMDPDGQLLISVCDTGVGLPAEKMDQIFNPFFTTKAQGSGMGLAISRSIIEAHGGRLWACVNDGRGATFHFTLPGEATVSSASVL